MTTHRKLAAILSADAAGYSRLMADDETATLRSLNDARALFRKRIEAHGGRLIDTAGDSVLAEFPSAVEAVDCAGEIQHELGKRNSQLAEHRRMQFRIGINLGDVIEQEDGTIYGDGVNVAARLQALTEPAGICISGTAYDQVEGKLPLQFKFIGEQQVKNIAKPVRAYRVLMDARPVNPRPGPIVTRRALALGAAVVIAVILVVGAVWQTQKPVADKSVPSNDPALTMPTGPAIAVLPFTNMSGDPKQEYFADGISEQIIAELSRFRDLYVIARNSTFGYKGKSVDVRQLGRELGARYILEGSVRRDAQRMRVTAQLLDAKSGAHLWAETYERQLSAGAIFDVQDEITSHVVGAIAGAYGAISRATWEQSKARATANLDAYECVLVTREYWRTNAEIDHLRARDCLEKAVKLDPDYAEAWAMLAMVYGEEHMFAYNLRPDPIGRAFRAAQRAIELDPTHQRAQESLANVYFYQRDVIAVIPQAERAVALNPNNEDTLANMGLQMVYIGMTNPAVRDRGLALVRKAMALNRHHPGWYHFPTAWTHWWKGEYQQAIAEAAKINQPDLFWTHVTFAMIYGATDQRSKATSAIAQVVRLYPTFSEDARDEFRKWNLPDAFIERAVENLRRAGLAIPDAKN